MADHGQAVPADSRSATGIADLVGVLADAVAVLGPDGRVEWANRATAALLGVAVDDLIGSDGLERLHPDEVARALDGIAYSAAFPDRTAVVPYRLRRGDGSYQDVELRSSVAPTPSGDRLVLVLRDGTTRSGIAAALASIAAGEPVVDTMSHVAAAVRSRWPGTAVAVRWRVEAEVQRLDVSMPPALSAWTDRQVHEVAAGRRDEPALSVWAEAATSGEPVVVRAEELDAQGAALASRSGFGACGVAPVPDPTGATAWIVAWFDEPQAALLEFAHWAHEPVGLVHLALERRWHLDRLHEAARRDPLTGLANRTGFFESLDTRLERARRDDSLLAVVFLDLDGFKPVNDVYGHAVGDRVLELVGRRLAGAVRSDDVVARVGGDEFAVVCGLAADAVEQGATELAGRLLATLAEPLTVTRDPGAPGLATPLEPVQLGASVGVAVTSPRAEQPLRVFERADAAMYRAKQAGRGAWVLDTHLVVDEEAGR